MGLRLTSAGRIRRYGAAGLWDGRCLQDLLEENACQTPGAEALVDSHDRESFAVGEPVALSYAQTWASVIKLQRVFDSIGLGPGDLLAVQLPQIVEAPIAIIAAARAGLITCMIPPHWGRRDLLAALDRVAPRAILSWASPDRADQRLENLREAAVELPSVRFLLAIGDDVPDGILPLGPFAVEARRHATGSGPEDTPDAPEDDERPEANDVGFVTWPACPRDDGQAFARSHNELKATGAVICDVADIGFEARLLCPYPMSSYAALGTFLVPWLVSGGCLAMHRPTGVESLAGAIAASGAEFTAIPAQLEPELVKDLTGYSGVATTIGILRDLRMASSQLSAPPGEPLRLVDIVNLGDMALHAAPRAGSGALTIPDVRHSGLKGPPNASLETHLAPPRPGEAPSTAEFFIRSPMTPSASVGGKGGVFAPFQGAEGYVSTGLVARKIPAGLVPSPVGSGSAIVHGALAIDRGNLATLYAAWPLATRVEIDTLPDPVMGQRIGVTIHTAVGNAATVSEFFAFLRTAGAGDHLIPDEIRFVHARNDADIVGETSGERAERALRTSA